MQECRKWLQRKEKKQYSPTEAKNTIQVYHRNTAETDKDAIKAEFRRPNSSIRVIFATEALGIGANLLDIRRVVQFRIPKGPEPAIFWQRGGRASRDTHDGEVILLVDAWLQGPRIQPSQRSRLARQELPESPLDDHDINIKSTSRSQQLTPEERRGKLPEFWYILANSSTCLRNHFLDYFDESLEYRHETRTERCCSNCNPEFQLNGLEHFYLYHEAGPAISAHSKGILKSIDKWANQQINVAFSNRSFIPTANSFLSSERQERLARFAHEIFKPEDLRVHIAPWDFFDSHAEELV
jgi:superfamily II DNA helicase RecQ